MNVVEFPLRPTPRPQSVRLDLIADVCTFIFFNSVKRREISESCILFKKNRMFLPLNRDEIKFVRSK